MRETVQQVDLELAKWVAIVTMAVDHYGKIVDPEVLLVTHAVGRLSFPLFATVIGMRLALRPDLAGRYMRRLLIWALISQPVFVHAGRDWWDGNIMFTLLLGVAATALLHRFAATRAPGHAFGAVAVLLPAWFLDYGLFGAAMIPATALLAAERPLRGLWMSGPLGVLANAVPAWPPLVPVDLCALPASAVALASARLRIGLPRLPTQVFYAFYPAHLLALDLYDLATRT